MATQNVANPITSNSGAVACAEDTGDLAQCLAERLVQNTQDAADRSKKRHKVQPEGVAFMQSQPQPLQPLTQPALSQVMMQLTASHYTAVRPEAEHDAHRSDNGKQAASRLPDRVVQTPDISPELKVAVHTVRPTHDGHSPSTASPVAIVHAPRVLAAVSATDISTRRKGAEEPVDKIVSDPFAMPRAVGSQPNPQPAKVELITQAEAALQTPQRAAVLSSAVPDDVSATVVSKTIDLDLQADQVVVRYAVNDQASARLQVAEQAIMPASSDGRLNNMLIGQQSLTVFDAGWTLHGTKQARPYYLSSVSNQDRVKETDKTWDERDQ